MPVQLLRKKFTVREFQQIAEKGILDDTRLELIEGEIIDMGKIGRRHAAFVRRFIRLLSPQIEANQALLDAQNPIELSPDSQPQPDLTLLSPRDDDYEARHPFPEDVLLLIEIADTTLESDREIKMPLYARGGIRESWLVDLNERQVTVYRQPSPEGYRLIQIYTLEETISPSLLPSITIALRDLFSR